MILPAQKKYSWPHYAVIIARFALGGVFLYSGIQHIMRPHEFLAAISAYQLAQPQINVFVAAVLPWVEAISGICAIGGFFREGSLILIALLLGVYVIAIGSALARNLQIACGCFDLGNRTSSINLTTLMRTLSLFIVSLALYAHTLLVGAGKRSATLPN